MGFLEVIVFSLVIDRRNFLNHKSFNFNQLAVVRGSVSIFFISPIRSLARFFTRPSSLKQLGTAYLQR